MTFAEVLARRHRFESAFWKRVNKTESCWLWTTGINSEGYGYYNFWASDGKVHQFRAHRLAWFLLRGDIPTNLVPDHLCHVRHCVNPDHIELVSIRTNALRGRNSIVAINAAKTHCKRGHELIPENLAPNNVGTRACKICRNQQKRIRRANRNLDQSKGERVNS